MSIQAALADKLVINTLKQAWEKTLENKVEWGGWICETSDGGYAAKAQTDGQAMGVVLTRPKDLENLKSRGYKILAQYHCHPGKGVPGCRPSRGDVENAKNLSYPSLVFTHAIDHDYRDIAVLRGWTFMAAPAALKPKAVMWYKP